MGREMKTEDKLFSFIKLFTYIIASVSLLASSAPGDMTLLVFCISFLVVNSFFRQMVLLVRLGNHWSILASVVAEILLITFIITMDRTNVGISFYLFFVVISETATSMPALPALLTAVGVLAAGLIQGSLRSGLDNLLESALRILPGFGTGVVFVFVMSYIVKRYMLQRDRLRRANEELEQAYGKLVDSASKAQELAVEKERTRMAREIHDTLAHTLTAAIVQLEACRKLVGVDAARAGEEIEKAQTTTREGLNEVKRTIKALRPQVLENRSLLDAVGILAVEAGKGTGVKVEMEVALAEDFKPAVQVETALFRIIQESITNAVRHGNAAVVKVSVGQEKDSLQLVITDDGKGCSHINKGFGLQGISERVEAMGGTARFLSSPGNGFRTEITIPVRGGTSDAH